MQVQLNTSKQNSNPAFGNVYKFSGRPNIGQEVYKLLIAKGAQPPRDFIGGCLGDTFHLATGKDSFTPPAGMPHTNGLSMLCDRVIAAGKNVTEIVLDRGRAIEEQLGISLKAFGTAEKQEIDILKS